MEHPYSSIPVILLVNFGNPIQRTLTFSPKHLSDLTTSLTAIASIGNISPLNSLPRPHFRHLLNPKSHISSISPLSKRHFLWTLPWNFIPLLHEILDDPMNTYEYTLQEGDAVLFDNRRVLLSRTAFKDQPSVKMKQGEINRWLKGCHLEADALVDRVRMLRAKLENKSINWLEICYNFFQSFAKFFFTT